MTVSVPEFVPIIAIAAGAPQSGKSTLARHFMEKEGFEPLSFAMPLKRMLIQLLLEFGYDEETAYLLVTDRKEVVIPELGTTSRDMLRTLGTEWGRDLVRQTMWIDCWKWRAWAAIKQGVRGIVCDDLRFANELEMVRSLGGIITYVHNSRAIAAAKPKRTLLDRLLGRNKPHRSEGAITRKDADVVVMNDDTLHSYRETLRSVPALAFDSIDKEARRRYTQFAQDMCFTEAMRDKVFITALKNNNPVPVY